MLKVVKHCLGKQKENNTAEGSHRAKHEISLNSKIAKNEYFKILTRSYQSHPLIRVLLSDQKDFEHNIKHDEQERLPL